MKPNSGDKVWACERTSGFLTLAVSSCLEQGLLCPCPNPEAAFTSPEKSNRTEALNQLLAPEISDQWEHGFEASPSSLAHPHCHPEALSERQLVPASGFYLLFIHSTNIYLSNNYYKPDLSQVLRQ